VAVVATIAIEEVPVEYGGVAHVIGSGEGGVVSDTVSVVAHAGGVEKPVAFCAGLLSRA
jgi:hypothetical protein